MKLAGLGMFVFQTSTAAFGEFSRRRDYRHASADRFGALPASQYLGPGEDVIRLSGQIVPQLGHAYSSLQTLADMAETGKPHPFFDGDGRNLGDFVITNIDELRKLLLDNGRARQIDFSLEFRRVR